MSSCLLSLDPGRNCGIAYSRRDGSIAYRTWGLQGLGGGLLVELDGLLSHLHQTEGFTGISYERPFFSARHPTAAEPLIEMTGHIKYWAALRGLPCVGYTPPEIKRVWASGKASKTTMIERARRFGFDPATDHEADALAQLQLLIRNVPPVQEARRAAAKTAARERKRDDLFAPKRKRRIVPELPI